VLPGGASRKCCQDSVLVSCRREAPNGVDCEPWGRREAGRKRQMTDASGQGTNLRDGALKTKTIHRLSRSADFQVCQHHTPSSQGDSFLERIASSKTNAEPCASSKNFLIPLLMETSGSQRHGRVCAGLCGS
jgi:hypothetical protein